MMYNGKVPHHLWVEAFFSSVFLINLLPSSVLPDHKSPYEMLNKRQPVYTALRVFGYKCFPSLRPYMQHKLDPKSLVFVFLRYNEKYKGYWCYYPPTGRVFIIRHVLFDENSFPFGDIYSSYHAKSSSALLNAWQDASLIRQHSTQISPNTEEELVHCPQTVEGTATAPQVVLPVPSPPHPGSPTSVSATESDETMTNNQQEEVHEEEVQQSQPVHPMTTRAKAGISKPNPKYALFTVKD